MLNYVTGNIFDSERQCIINPVNCVGVMGKGLALEFKRQYPDMFTKYQEICTNGSLHIGSVVFYASKRSPHRSICLFPTKYDWRDKSTIGILDLSFQAFVEYASQMKIQSAAFPKVGCGLGGLNFEKQVQPLFERYFTHSKYSIDIYL